MTTPTVDDLFFREIVSSYVSRTPRFLRRDWLAQKLDICLAEPSCRLVLISAEPGAGKSAFVAQLASDHNDWPVFFIRRDQRTFIGEASARSFLLRIGFELAAIHPELFEIDQVQIEIQQRIGSADAEVVGAEIQRLRASPFHQTVVRIKQDIKEAGGSVAAVHIGEWIADPRLIELEDLQQLALFGPAHTLKRLHPEHRIVLLVDALDELRYHNPEQDLLEWLGNCPPLPDNMRIVLTSRPPRGPLSLFQEKRKESLVLLPLESNDEDVQRDVRRYAEELLAPVAITSALSGTGRKTDAFLTDLVAKADGNIGYLAALGRAFDQALAKPEHSALLEDLLALKELPGDLQGLFTFFLHLIQNGPGLVNLKVVDPDSGKAALLEAWPELYHPVLAVLAVALQPLTLDQIHVLTGTLADRIQLTTAMDWLAQFLDRIGNTYRLYHGTLAEFLSANTTRSEAPEFYVNAAPEHLRIATVLEGKGWPDAIWQESPEPREQHRRDYARRHYITHLYLGNAWERLYRAIDEGRYGLGKLRFDRSSYLYSRDLDLAISTVSRKELDDASRLAELPRLWRYKLLRCTLSSFAGDLAPSCYRALALVNRDREAIDLTELITDPRIRSLASANISAVLASKTDQIERAATLLQSAYEAALRLDEPTVRGVLLNELLNVSGPFFDPACTCGSPVRGSVLRLVRSFSKPSDRADALASLIRALHSAGQADEVAALRNEIRALAPQDDEEAVLLLYTYSILASAVGDFEIAHVAASNIRYAGYLVKALTFVAGCEYQAGAEAAADKTVATIAEVANSAPPGLARARLFTSLAEANQKSGHIAQSSAQLNEAFSQLRRNDSSRPEIEALLEVARIARADGNEQLFGEIVQIVLSAALKEIAEHPDKPGQGYTMSLIAINAALGLANLDQCEEALKIADGLHYYEIPGLLAAVVESFVARAQWDRAITVVKRIGQVFSQGPVRISLGSRGAGSMYGEEDQGFLSVSVGLGRKGEWQRAMEIAERIKSAGGQRDCLAQVASLKHEAGLTDQATELVSSLFQQLRLSNTTRGRDEALVHTVKLLVETRQWQKARDAARSIQSSSDAAQAQSAILTELIASGELEIANAAMEDTASAYVRAESLVLLATRLSDAGDDNNAVIRTLLAAREQAIQEERMIDRARLLRSIAVAFGDLFTGQADQAFAAMGDAVDALNKAPRFQFVPTPWCDTAVAYAKLGNWNGAMKIANGLVNHDAFDGCSALVRLAELAREKDELSHAEALLAQAKSSAPKILFPPQQAGILAQLAKEYTYLGKVDEAMKDDLLTPMSRRDALGQIAVALVESGQTDEALKLIESAGRELTDSARASLAGEFLKAGDTQQAQAIAEGIADAPQRAETLEAVASRLFALGRSDDARKLTDQIFELRNSFRNPYARTDFLKKIAADLASYDQAAAALMVEEQWLAAPTRMDLLRLIPLAAPLVQQQPVIASEISASFGWVENILLAV